MLLLLSHILFLFINQLRKLLADAEFREDLTEDFVGGDLAGDCA
jgi:hypothetical protein